MAVKTITGTRRELTAAAGEVIASGYAAPARWDQPEVSAEIEVLETIGQLLLAWLWVIEETEAGSDLSPLTREQYRFVVARVLGPRRAPLLRHQQLDDWTAVTALAWSRRRALVCSRATHEGDRKVLRAAWRWATSQGYLDRPDPLVGLEWPRRWGGRKYTNYTPTVQEVYATLQGMHDTPSSQRARLIITVVWATGARIGEVVSLTRADLDLSDPEDSWVTLQGAVEGERTGKGRGEQEHREAALNPECVRLLRDHLASMPADQERLWVGNVKSINETVRSQVRRTSQRLGGPHWSPHGLRRLMVDDMIRDGVDVATAAKITGHSAMTMLRKYRQVTRADKREAARRVRRQGMKQGNVLQFSSVKEG